MIYLQKSNKMCDKPCKECPWVLENTHSLKFRKYVEKMKSIGIESHACHLTTKDIWGYKIKINSKNICKGYLKNNLIDEQ